MFFVKSLVPGVSFFNIIFYILLGTSCFLAISFSFNTWINAIFWFTKHQIFFYWLLSLSWIAFSSSWHRNICSYRYKIIGGTYIISINTSHPFCIILWLYNNLSFVFAVSKCSGSGNIDTFLTFLRTTQNKTSLIKLNHHKISHSTNYNNLTFS